MPYRISLRPFCVPEDNHVVFVSNVQICFPVKTGVFSIRNMTGLQIQQQLGKCSRMAHITNATPETCLTEYEKLIILWLPLLFTIIAATMPYFHDLSEITRTGTQTTIETRKTDLRLTQTSALQHDTRVSPHSLRRRAAQRSP